MAPSSENEREAHKSEKGNEWKREEKTVSIWLGYNVDDVWQWGGFRGRPPPL